MPSQLRRAWPFGAAVAALVLALACAAPAHAYTLTMYSNANYNTDVATMNANLGLSSGFVFEDFEDATLHPLLAVSQNGTSLSYGSTTYPSAAWTPNPSLLWDYTAGSLITFTIAGGTDAFGIGFGEYDAGGSGLYINSQGGGIDYTAMAGFTLGGVIRNGFLVIQRASGDPALTSVQFSGGANQTIVTFDHVAIGVPVPEPGASFALALLAAVAAGHRRSGRASTKPARETPSFFIFP